MEILLRTPPHQNPKEFSTPCTTSQNPLHQGGTKEPERKERWGIFHASTIQERNLWEREENVRLEIEWDEQLKSKRGLEMNRSGKEEGLIAVYRLSASILETQDSDYRNEIQKMRIETQKNK